MALYYSLPNTLKKISHHICLVGLPHPILNHKYSTLSSPPLNFRQPKYSLTYRTTLPPLLPCLSHLKTVATRQF